MEMESSMLDNELYLQPKIDKAERVIKDAIARFSNLGIAFSGGSDSLVALNMILPYYWDIPVLFVDTRYQFPETYIFVNKIKKEWNLNLHTYKAKEAKYKYFVDKHGKDTEDFYYNCCIYHKVQPLMVGIKDLKLEACIFAIRAVEHPERAKETVVSYKMDLDPPHYRIHPILEWSRQDVIDYMLLHNVPVNPLYNNGYTSLGCTHCTKPNPNKKRHERYGRARKRELIKWKLKMEGYN